MSEGSKTQGMPLPISIEGELTIYRVAEIREAILPQIALATEIEVNLSGVSEIDGAGLQLLISTKVEAWRQNKAVRFVGHSAVVTEAIDLCGLSAFFGDPIIISSKPE